MMRQERPLDAVMRATQIVADWATRTGRALAAIACLFGQIPTADIAAAADSAAAADLPAYAVYRDGVLQGWIVPTMHAAPPRLLVPHPDVLQRAGIFIFESVPNAEAFSEIELPIYSNDWIDYLPIDTQLYMREQARCRGLQPDIRRYHRFVLLALTVQSCKAPMFADNDISLELTLERFARSNSKHVEYLETIMESADILNIIALEEFIDLVQSSVAGTIPEFFHLDDILTDQGLIDSEKVLQGFSRLEQASKPMHRLFVDLGTDERNRRWADGIAARPPSAVYVMFVGAAHTITERSLQELLRQRGHEIVSLRLPAITLGTMVRITRSATR
jgi:uncharacterized protein YbaP (TraB family)